MSFMIFLRLCGDIYYLMSFQQEPAYHFILIKCTQDNIMNPDTLPLGRFEPMTMTTLSSTKPDINATNCATAVYENQLT